MRAAALVLALGPAAGCLVPADAGRFYDFVDLSADRPGLALHVDPGLRDPRGLARGADGGWWVADRGSGLATDYDGEGRSIPGERSIGIPAAGGGFGAPSAVAFDPADEFVITSGDHSEPSEFLYATEDGTLLGWNPGVDLRYAVLAVDRSGDGRRYEGLAVGTDDRGTTRLYAADFAGGAIDVYDDTFGPATDLAQDAFRDPDVPVGYGPYGLLAVDQRLFVSWDRIGDDGRPVAGVGVGYVDVFDLDGRLVDQVASAGRLDAPGPMALAPREFGRVSNALLVGNQGDGRILAFADGRFDELGELDRAPSEPVVIDGLTGLAFGNGDRAGDRRGLYFVAAPGGDGGRFGLIEPR